MDIDEVARRQLMAVVEAEQCSRVQITAEDNEITEIDFVVFS